MKTLLKQSKLIEKLILDEDEDILSTNEENIGELKIFNTEDRIKELEAIKKERPLTDEELEELAYCKNEVDSRNAETRYLNGESLKENRIEPTDEPIYTAFILKPYMDIYYFPNVAKFDNEEDAINYCKENNCRGYRIITKDTITTKYPGQEDKTTVVKTEDDPYSLVFEESLKESEEEDLLELEEPIDEEPIEDNIEEPTEPVTQEIADNAYLTEINDLITTEYGKIDTVKSLIATFASEDAVEKNSEIISILNAFIDETTIAIGMLTKASELIDSTTSDLMQQGIDKAEEVINNVDEEEVKEEE